MGRHARGAAHLRISVSTVVLGTLIVTVVAVGSLLSSHAQPTPIAAEGVEGTAVVVSSLACQDGAGGTEVDVLSPAGLPAGTRVRATLDACGYQEGEQIAVQFAASDPTRVTFLGNPVDGTATTGRLLPYGLMLAVLLAAGAAAAVFHDARRSRRARASAQADEMEPAPREPGTIEPGATAANSSGVDSVEDGESTWSTTTFRAFGETMVLPAADSPARVDSSRPVGRHARRDPDPGNGSTLENPSPLLVMVTAQAAGAASEMGEPVDRVVSGERELSSVDLSFPYTASLADSLHDELFTHRTVWS